MIVDNFDPDAEVCFYYGVAAISRLINAAGGPSTVSTVFDVGAYDGADSLPIAERYPQMRVIAVEPTPHLAERLRQRSAHLPNYSVIEAAIGPEDTERRFNVFAGADWLNSLHSLRDGPAMTLVGRESSNPDSRPTVQVKRLATLCDEIDVSAIDVLHIDTQASDLDVLKSLDLERLAQLRAGVVEVSHRHRLYDHSIGEVQARAIIAELGFRVFRVERVRDSMDIEHNYFFAPTGRSTGAAFDEIAFRMHFLAGEARALLMRHLGWHLIRLRVKAGIRARIRRMRTK